MKRPYLIAALLCAFCNQALSSELAAEKASSAPRLVGIIKLPGPTRAILETVGGWPRRMRAFILTEGEMDAGIEVLQIYPYEGNARVRLGGNEMLMSLTGWTNQAPTSVPGIALDQAGLDAVLRLYQGFADRTLLRSPRLPGPTFTLRSIVTNEAQGALLLKKALAEKGITTIPDGDKFVLVVPTVIGGVNLA